MSYFDQFSIYFSGDTLLAGNRKYHLGEITTGFLNLPNEFFKSLQSKTDEFAPVAREMFASKNEKAAPAVQEKLNAVFDLLIDLPPYRDIGIDIFTSYHMLPLLIEQPEKWSEVITQGTEAAQGMEHFISTIENLAHSIFAFTSQADTMLEQYFEPLKRRNADAYGFAFATYYKNMLKMQPIFAPEIDWGLSTEVTLNYLPANTFDGTGKFVIAEQMQFTNLVSFLYADLYRGLMHGNCPRRCQNCGKYFLLTAGYNTCYCNNIAPGETLRTCRKVGAHRKAEREKASGTPAQREYRKAYDRLKMRKARHKISVDEWNEKVALAQQLRDEAEQGELTGLELRDKLSAL